MKKEVIVYGAGQMGRAVCSILEANDTMVRKIVDKGMTEPKTVFGGHREIPAIHPEGMDSEDWKLDVIVSITAVSFFEVKTYLKQLGAENVFPAGDYLEKIFRGAFTNCGCLNEMQYETALKIKWDDEESGREWKMACDWFYNRNEKFAVQTGFRPDREKYFPDFIRKLLSTGDVMIDGAYLDGAYSKKFVELTGGRVYAFSLVPQESPKVSPEKAVQLEARELAGMTGEVVRNRAGLMKPFNISREYRANTVSVDDYVAEKGIPVMYLRAYSMSEILDLLMGAKKTIDTCRPIIAANLAHYMTDFLLVPYFLKLYCRDYLFLFRMHSFQGNDCLMYAIPMERKEYE